jgi:hypothetical protein
MTFEELIDQVQKLNCEEKRALEANYSEVVVTKDVLPSLNAILQTYFGVPFKPLGKSANPEAARYAKPYGGVESNQILYLKKSASSVELALLWPWGSGASVTVKIIRQH